MKTKCYIFAVAVLIAAVFSGCKEDAPYTPSVHTGAFIDGSNVISYGSNVILRGYIDGGLMSGGECGFYYDTIKDLSNPKIVTAVYDDGTYDFWVELTDLPLGTYYYQAYARQYSGGIFGYGEIESFTISNYNEGNDSGSSSSSGEPSGNPSEATTGTLNGHDWVDLGLPSGLRWATCNVGASSPEDYGNYYAWGEITTKTTYSISTYTYTGNPTTLPSSADAATANWGSDWRMPTQSEMQELLENSTCTWTSRSGVYGRLFTGPNGNSIFLPAAGGFYASSLYYDGGIGYYWSSSLYSSSTDYAWYLYFSSVHYYVDYIDRYRGKSVRAVCN